MTDETDKKRERAARLLLRLAALCDEFGAGFTYTNADDGVHISIDGEDVYVGHLLDPAKDLTDAAKKIKGGTP